VTIALGLLHSRGVLMCSDTLLSNGTVGWHESKVIGGRFADGVCLFAFAGNADLAESCIQLCIEGLKVEISTPRTRVEIVNAIRPTLAREYKLHVIDAQRQATHDYALLVAVWSKRDGVGLYSTNGTSMRKSRRGYESIGAGNDIAQFLVRPHYASFLPEAAVTALAVYALSSIRRAMPGVVGGNLLIFRLFSDGGVGVVTNKDIEVAAKYSALFDSEARHLLSGLLGIDTIPSTPDAVFASKLERFSVAIDDIMRRWKKARTRLFPEPEAEEAMEVIRAVSSPEVMREVKRLQKFPRRARSRQRPSLG
jgi:hypothetical protein